MASELTAARKAFHAALLEGGVLCMANRQRPKQGWPPAYPSNADGSSSTSIALAMDIYRQLNAEEHMGVRLAGQISGSKFEQITRRFIEQTFGMVQGLRPGNWVFDPPQRSIDAFEQYRHLAEISRLAQANPELSVLMGSDYIIAPDVLVARLSEPDDVINRKYEFVDETVAIRSPLRAQNNLDPILHASISCKWTLRSDRAQNARSEALNLIRNRKGRVPHIVVVTGEPLPSRLASLALGTGDIDAVYHFALPELMRAVESLGQEEAASILGNMVDGKRLKDISDLPLDLAV